MDLDELDDENIIPDKDERTLTPAGVTRITLNPKVDGEPTDLLCPYCDVPIQAWSGADGNVVEYRCECDELRKFRIRGEDDAD